MSRPGFHLYGPDYITSKNLNRYDNNLISPPFILEDFIYFFQCKSHIRFLFSNIVCFPLTRNLLITRKRNFGVMRVIMDKQKSTHSITEYYYVSCKLIISFLNTRKSGTCRLKAFAINLVVNSNVKYTLHIYIGK